MNGAIALLVGWLAIDANIDLRDLAIFLVCGFGIDVFTMMLAKRLGA